jgi:hypothetical protein
MPMFLTLSMSFFITLTSEGEMLRDAARLGACRREALVIALKKNLHSHAPE